MARPTKLDERMIEQILNSARVIYHYKWIAASVGVDEVTIHRWKKENEDFASQLEQARADFIKDNLKKARPDFKLETADREIFGNKTEVVVSIDPAKELLKKYDLIDEGENVKQVDSP